ncbi:unnamed protein product [Symbiodinium natans]|uniref:Uncharacterized protein n=1 Tax=Symbiodinium natans TaxID=878477 RepID=A0A812JT97_9DINO|nr:unnamed protein product [Symbiodinium natans]
MHAWQEVPDRSQQLQDMIDEIGDVDMEPKVSRPARALPTPARAVLLWICCIHGDTPIGGTLLGLRWFGQWLRKPHKYLQGRSPRSQAATYKLAFPNGNAVFYERCFGER